VQHLTNTPKRRFVHRVAQRKLDRKVEDFSPEDARTGSEELRIGPEELRIGLEELRTRPLAVVNDVRPGNARLTKTRPSATPKLVEVSKLESKTGLEPTKIAFLVLALELKQLDSSQNQALLKTASALLSIWPIVKQLALGLSPKHLRTNPNIILRAQLIHSPKRSRSFQITPSFS
jgi:hypothetical protein